MSRVGFKTAAVKEDERKELLPVVRSNEADGSTCSILQQKGFEESMAVVWKYLNGHLQNPLIFGSPDQALIEKLRLIKRRYFDDI